MCLRVQLLLFTCGNCLNIPLRKGHKEDKKT